MEHDASGLLHYKLLPGLPSFRALAEDGAGSIDDRLAFLAQADWSEQQRLIAILSMHRLGADDYAVFLRGLVRLRDQDLASARELERAIIQYDSFGAGLAENYRNPAIRTILTEIASRQDIAPSMRTYMSQLLSGQLLRDSRIFQWDCCNGPTPWAEFMADVAFGLLISLLLWPTRGNIRRTMLSLLIPAGLYWLALWSDIYPNFYWIEHLVLVGTGGLAGALLRLLWLYVRRGLMRRESLG